jgi:dual specificity tyrosine-phosphorylation-regulated kinase 2/3/4
MISTRRALFFDGGKPKITTNSRGKKRHPGSRNLEEKLRIADDIFLDLIQSKIYIGTLDWNPMKRITPMEALQHPWLNENPSRLKTALGARTVSSN